MVVAVIKSFDFIVHVYAYVVRGSIDDLIDIWGCCFVGVNFTDFNYINHVRLDSFDFNFNNEASDDLQKDHDCGFEVKNLNC